MKPAAGRIAPLSLPDIADDSPEQARKLAEERLIHMLASLREDLQEATERKTAIDRGPARVRAERAARLAEALDQTVRAAEIERTRCAAVGASLPAEMAGEVEGLLARLRAMVEGLKGADPTGAHRPAVRTAAPA